MCYNAVFAIVHELHFIMHRKWTWPAAPSPWAASPFVATQRARSPCPGCSVLCQSERGGRKEPAHWGTERAERRQGRESKETIQAPISGGIRQRMESGDRRTGAFTLIGCCSRWYLLISESRFFQMADYISLIPTATQCIQVGTRDRFWPMECRDR